MPPKNISLTDVLGDPNFHQLPAAEKVKVLAHISGVSTVPQPDMSDIGLNLPGNTDQQNTLGVLRSMFPSIRGKNEKPAFRPDDSLVGPGVANAEQGMNLLPAGLMGAGLAAGAGTAAVGAAGGIGAVGGILGPFLAKRALNTLDIGSAYTLLKKLGILH